MATMIKARTLSSIIKSRIKHLTKEAHIKLSLAPYECLYPFYKNQFKPSAAHQQFSLNAKQIYGNHRLPGVSGYYWLYNEADFLAASVESHLPFFDELILVHDNTVTDKTPQIAQTLAAKYPDKIKYFVYQPEAFKSRTKAYKIAPSNHPNSFINYCNFTLSKTTREIVAKVDGDHIAIQSEFAKITDNFHNRDFMQNVFYTFRGLDLWHIDNQLLVDLRNTSFMCDHGFHLMRLEKHYYTKEKQNQGGHFKRKNRQIKNAGLLYFHLKNMRSGIPYHSYRGLDDKAHQRKFKQRFASAQQKWLDWDSFTTQYRDIFLKNIAVDIAELPDPNIYLKDLIKQTQTLKSEDFR